MTAQYKNHGKEGQTIHWFPNGTKRSEQNYSRDVEVQTSSFWENNGQLVTQKVYKSGTLVKTMDYREASILTRNGYLHVFNKVNSNFTVRFNGENVNPINAEVLAFLVDGKAIEVAALPLTLMYDEGEIPDNHEEILQKHKGVEVQYLKEIYDVEELPIEEYYERNRRGNQYLIWKFNTPKKEEKEGEKEGEKEKKLILKGEVNAVIVCQNHLLYLTAPVINAQKPADLERALQAIIETIELQDKPIDVIELSKKQ